MEQAQRGDPAAVARRDLPDADRAARRDRHAGRRGDPPGPRRHRLGRRACCPSASRSSTSHGSCRCHPSTGRRAGALRHIRQRLLPDPHATSFFVSLRGTRVIYECVWPTFRGLCERAGVGAGSHRPAADSRPRHTIRRQDAARLVSARASTSRPGSAWLSTYLGHRDPRYTYYYLSAAPDLLAHAARLLDDAQEVGHDPDRPDAAGVLHRPPRQPAARQPAHDRLLPRHAAAAALLHPAARPASSPPRWTGTTSTRP